MNRDEKNQAVATLHDEIGSATNAFLIEFKGITVPQVTELRRQIREARSNYVVVKNTIALIALKDSPMIELREQFSGPTAVAYGQDAVILAKTLTRFARDVPALIFKGALLDGKVVAATEIDTIANLPTREELVSKLLFVLQTPIRNFVTVLSANQRNLAVVLDQIARQRSGSEPDSDESGRSVSPDRSVETDSSVSPESSTSPESLASPEIPAPSSETDASRSAAFQAAVPPASSRQEELPATQAPHPEASSAPVVSSSEAENSTPSESSESSENSTASENDSNQSEKEPIGG